MSALRSRARPAAAVALLAIVGTAGGLLLVAPIPALAADAAAAPKPSEFIVGDPTATTSAAAAEQGQAAAVQQGQAAAVQQGEAAAVDAEGQLKDPVLEARFENLTKQLRCLVCQNESIADSNAELAGQLRRQVREMLIAGQSDTAIFQFMTDRYGEFVRFNTPLEPKTLLIWGAPFILLLIGAGTIYRIVRERSRMPLDDEPASGTP
jgi:cytochrome c-type biogenesis protein CcmH